MPDGETFESMKEATLSANDEVSFDYYLSGELGRSYIYKGFITMNAEEFYGFWGASSVNRILGDVTIMGVGTVRLKDYEVDLDMDLSIWPPWVPSPPDSTGTAGGDAVLRLKEGVERFILTDINSAASSAKAQSTIPVMWDTFGSREFGDNVDANVVFNHVPGGSNVLYMDGHVEYVKFGDKFPLLKDDQIVKENSHYGLG
jgi:prepilin-type processing-associated H-X9-DG protein